MKMVKEILTLSDIQIENSKFYHHKSPVCLRDVYFEKVLLSNNIFLGQRTINTAFVTCIMTIKLSH